MAGCPRICTDSWGIGGGKEFRIKFSFRERACGDVGKWGARRAGAHLEKVTFFVPKK